MSKVKCQRSNVSAGFTVMELMVVVSIMAVIAGVFILNLNGQRENRSLKVGENELLTNIRAAQSFTLSGRTNGVSQSVQYYLMKFTKGASNYTMQAMYVDPVDNNWKVKDVQTTNLPAGVTISGISINGSPITSSSTLVSFQTPYAEILMNDGVNPPALPNQPYSVIDTDDYKKILNFVINVNGSTTSGDKKMTLSLQYQKNTGNIKTIMINGVTGMICPVKDSSTFTCLANY